MNNQQSHDHGANSCDHHHHHNDFANTLSLALIMAVAVVIVAIAANADKRHACHNSGTSTTCTTPKAESLGTIP